MGLFANSTFYGNSVTYANGTRVLFSDYSCPRPVPPVASNISPIVYCSSTNDYYAMAMAAETNSSFTAAENGSNFMFQSFSGLTYRTNTGTCSISLFFYTYGHGSTFQCGGGLSGNYSVLFQRQALAGITVTFNSTGEYNSDGAWVSHGWDLKDPIVQVVPSDEAALRYSRSYPCG